MSVRLNWLQNSSDGGLSCELLNLRTAGHCHSYADFIKTE
jgi:hypothetical protein